MSQKLLVGIIAMRKKERDQLGVAKCQAARAFTVSRASVPTVMSDLPERADRLETILRVVLVVHVPAA